MTTFFLQHSLSIPNMISQQFYSPKAQWAAPLTTGSPNNLGTKKLVSTHHCKFSNQKFWNTNLQLKSLRQKLCQYSTCAQCEATGGNSFQDTFNQGISIVITDIIPSVQRKRENKVYHSRPFNVHSKSRLCVSEH